MGNAVGPIPLTLLFPLQLVGTSVPVSAGNSLTPFLHSCAQAIALGPPPRVPAARPVSWLGN